jgi:hypothetical protein
MMKKTRGRPKKKINWTKIRQTFMANVPISEKRLSEITGVSRGTLQRHRNLWRDTNERSEKEPEADDK